MKGTSMTNRVVSPPRTRPKGVLIIVENLSVPFDRRVWLEATELQHAGYQVSIICPKGKTTDTESFAYIDGISIYRYSLPPTATTTKSFVREYGTALLKTTGLSLRVFRSHRFQVMQSCNPPDFFFLLSLLYRPFGVRFVFDHHDQI